MPETITEHITLKRQIRRAEKVSTRSNSDSDWQPEITTWLPTTDVLYRYLCGTTPDTM